MMEWYWIVLIMAGVWLANTATNYVAFRMFMRRISDYWTRGDRALAILVSSFSLLSSAVIAVCWAIELLSGIKLGWDKPARW